MNNIELRELAGGELQKQFEESFEKVISNMLDQNTPYKKNREINIKMKFHQNEDRTDIVCDIQTSEKLAPQVPIRTAFRAGKDWIGCLYAEEYGSQVKGQMNMDTYFDQETGEILSEPQEDEDE